MEYLTKQINHSNKDITVTQMDDGIELHIWVGEHSTKWHVDQNGKVSNLV